MSQAHGGLFQPLKVVVSPYLPEEQIEEIYRAFLFGKEAHHNQTRVSGEPFIQHPIEVGCILGKMHMDYKTIVAAILHDTIEDTDTAREDIRVHFGEEVERLVEGVTKIEKIPAQNYEPTQADNMRKVLLAMTDDIRVIIIKLGDRLHNMKTLDALPPEKQRRIARETLDIYAPIALRFGMNKIRLELEELAFRYSYPWRHQVLSHHLNRARQHGRHTMSRIRQNFYRQLKKENINAEVTGREKHLYGIYAKMRRKKIPLKEISDLYAFRVITDSIQECYRALGAIHTSYKPLPGKFKDYIAIPKSNGYQSLHTVLFGPHGLPVEVQIRTREMEAVAESGIAAHWAYKSDDSSANGGRYRKLFGEWACNIMELQEHAGNPEEFMENLKVDLFPDQVFVFTPDGDIMKLPRGATVLDLAYTIHTDLGNHCCGAHIENRRCSTREILRSGQTVEVITSALTNPSPEWLDMAVTARARTRIRHYLKNIRLGKARQLGKDLLDRELNSLNKTLFSMDKETIAATASLYGLDDQDKLYETIGLGNIPATIVAHNMVSDKEQHGQKPELPPLTIKSSGNMVVSFARCCHPLPFDMIVAEFSPGRGLLIHRAKCRNRFSTGKRGNRIAVEWEEAIEGTFNSKLAIEVSNQPGVLAIVANSVASQNVNIVNVDIRDYKEMHTMLTFELEVSSVSQLTSVIHKMSEIPQVHNIRRL